MSACTSPSKVSEKEVAAAKPIHVIGHRGAAAYAPENTLPSFNKAFSIGLYEVELDIQMSKDGKIVLFHDDVLEKKTALKGRVRDYDWAELKNADIGTWFDRERGIPFHKYAGTKLNLLTDLFDTYGKQFYYHVEIKTDDPRLPAAIISLLKERDLVGQFIITSFYKEQLVRIHELEASFPLCYLIDDQKYEKDVAAAISESKKLGFNQVAVRAPVMSKDHVDQAAVLGLRIRGWGVKSKEDMDRVLAMGAEGMTIDWPDWLVRRILQKNY